DGRFVTTNDRVSHFALGGGGNTGNMILYGLTDQSISTLVPVGRGWRFAPSAGNLTGLSNLTYRQAERAYHLTANAGSLSFTLNATSDSMVVNPCFVVNNWNVTNSPAVSIDGVPLVEGSDFRSGIIYNEYGSLTSVIWVERESTNPITVSISGAVPDQLPPTPNPMTWASPPSLVNNSVDVTMTAADAADPNGVDYFFECLTDSRLNSNWQRGESYIARFLAPNKEYRFRVRARDGNMNETGWSDAAAVITGDAPDPIAFWNFNEGSGTTVNDSIANFNGYIIGASWTSGYTGTALQFDGDDYVSIQNADQISSQDAFSWSAWVKTNFGGAIFARSGFDDFYQEGAKCLYVNGDGYLVFDVGWVGSVESRRTLNDGNWHQVAVTVDDRTEPETITLYIDADSVG
ncbi:MAG: LamG-like jellyroll fold domain-containing protein, partial [Calditrichota bacterium]